MMANLINRSAYFGNQVCRRSIHASSVSLAKTIIPTSLEHATGPERDEKLAKAAGNENPFDMRVYKRTSGERDNPTVIPSFFKSRLVGCICQEDATCVQWMWLTKGEPKRCECGYFFQLTDAKPMV